MRRTSVARALSFVTAFSASLLLLLHARTADATATSIGLGLGTNAATVADAHRASGAVRSFSIDFEGDGVSDSVMFDPVSRSLVLCSKGLAERCSTVTDADAADFLPAQHVTETRWRLIRVSMLGNLAACSPSSGGGLRCDQSTDGFVRVHRQGTKYVAQIGRTGDSYTCSSGFSMKPLCSVGRGLIDVRKGLVFGRFSPGSPVQGLRLRNGVAELCYFSGFGARCIVAHGFEWVSSEAMWAAAVMRPTANSATLVLASDKQVSVCSRVGADPSHAQFRCNHVQGANLAQVQRLRVGATFRSMSNGRRVVGEGVVMLPSNEQLEAARSLAQQSGSAVSVAKLPISTVGSTETADQTVVNLIREMLEVAGGSEILVENRTGQISAMRGVSPDPLGQDEGLTYYASLWTFDGPGNDLDFEIWTDAINYLRWDWTFAFGLNPQQCANACDGQFEFDKAKCDQIAGFWADVAGTSLPVVGAFTFMFSGGNVPLTAASILGTISAAAGLISLRKDSCMAAAASSWVQCRTRAVRC